MSEIRHGQSVIVMAAALLLGCGTGDEVQQRDEIGAAGGGPVYGQALSEHKYSLGAVHSNGHALTDEHGRFMFASTPSGLTPDDLRSAYKIPSSGGSGKIVAIVDAFDNPNAEADLAVYRAQFGLPPCTTANGCFKKVNQDGKTSPLPGTTPGAGCPPTNWQFEISLDLDMASAGCPDCKLLLVEANDCYLSDLGAAELTAVRLGAAVVSNSWNGSEADAYQDAATDAMYFNHPGVSIFFSSGDGGFRGGPQYPASSQYVTAVGGTTLHKDILSFRGWSETVWGGALSSMGAGSGCSQVNPKPFWQKDLFCGKRMIADLAAVAKDVAVYDSYGGGDGWALGTYGTSIAAPLVAAIYAVTGNESAGPSLPYTRRGAFYDVIFGNNGICLLWPYFCAASLGYDGPTGIGTPNGAALAGK